MGANKKAKKDLAPVRNPKLKRQPKNHAIKYGSQRGAIDGKMNLVCSKGHKWYAPRPDFFVGRHCLHKGDGSTCMEMLALK